MKILRNLTVISLVVMGLLSAVPAFAADFHNSLSLQGFTGILNTPNAAVTDEGGAYFLFSDQTDSKWRQRTYRQENYMFSFGFFNCIEIGGRLVQAPPLVNDLSGSFKITSAPFFRDIQYMPTFAVGIQDVGGGVKFLQTKYAVLSEEIWRLRLSVGYGLGPDRMEGLFGGAELKAHDWVYLLGEYDTEETNVGVRITTPPFWKIPVSFTATAKTSLDYRPGNFDVAVGFSFPLDFRMPSRPKTQTSAAEEKQQAAAGEPAAETPPRSIATPPIPAGDDRLQALRARLISEGFLNVKVGVEKERTLVIEYENTIFNHSEVDAIGFVAGTAARVTGDGFDSMRLVVKKRGIRVIQLTLPVQTFMEFLTDATRQTALRSRMKVSARVDDAAVSPVEGEEKSSYPTLSLALWPGLKTFVGTDYGAFDYLLSLKPEAFVNVWKGGVLTARYDIPLSWSENLDDGKPYRGSRAASQLERLMLFQGLALNPGLMANIGAGMIFHDVYGTVNEVVWQPGDGTHRVRLAQLRGENDRTHAIMESYLASYRYYFAPLDLSLEGTAGRFLFEDKGGMVELKRYFRDTGLSVYYKKSTTQDDRRWDAVGVQIAFPLTPRRDMKHVARMQLRGTEQWSYAQESTLKNTNKGTSALNYLADVPLTAIPLLTGSLYNQYFDRDRLHGSYILSHLERLREGALLVK